VEASHSVIQRYLELSVNGATGAGCFPVPVILQGDMKMSKRISICFRLILACLFLSLLFQGCARLSVDQEKSGKNVDRDFISIGVTKEFGKVFLKEAQVRWRKSSTVMDALEKICRVEKAYGGGFVKAIDGIASAKGKDWFYYVNGTLADVGAALYETGAKDEIWWDYHAWGRNTFIPTVIGSYPKPFTVGYGGKKRPTTIVYSSEFHNEARAIGKYLGAEGARVLYSKDLSKFEDAKKNGPVIVILNSPALHLKGLKENILRHLNLSGTFIRVEGEKIIVLDEEANPSSVDVEVTGAVVCAGVGMGDASPIWFLLFLNDESKNQIVKILTGETRVLKHKVGLVIDSRGEIRALPFGENR